MEEVPNKTFVNYKGRDYTWTDIEKASQIIAMDLYQQGVRRGSHVALCGSNSVNWIFT
ncbi:MAG: AMP-binding protein, partial [Ruminiclostridium sp.]|nr:AMP-binding protein [Ruminiclostridium sp.]